MGSLCANRARTSSNGDEDDPPQDPALGGAGNLRSNSAGDAIIVDDDGLGFGKARSVPDTDVAQLFPSDVSSSSDENELSFHSALEDVHRMHKAKFGVDSLIHEKRVVFVSLYTLSQNFDSVPLHIWRRSIVVAAADKEWCKDAIRRMQSEGVEEGTQLSRKAATIWSSAKTKPMVYSMKLKFLCALLEKDEAFDRRNNDDCDEYDDDPAQVGVPTHSHRPRSSSASKSIGGEDGDSEIIDSIRTEESGCVLWFSPTSMESLDDWIEASRKVSKLRALFNCETDLDDDEERKQKSEMADKSVRPAADSLLSAEEDERIRKMSSGSATLGTPVPTDPGKTPSLMDRSTPDSKEATTLSGSQIPLTHESSEPVGHARFSVGTAPSSGDRAQFTTINSDSPTDGGAHTSDLIDPVSVQDGHHPREEPMKDDDDDDPEIEEVVIRHRLRDDSVARLDKQIEEVDRKMETATGGLNDYQLKEKKRMLSELKKVKIVEREKNAIMNGEDWEDSTDIAMRNRLFQVADYIPDERRVETHPFLKPLILDKHWWKFHYVTNPANQDETTVQTAHTGQYSTALVSHGVTFEMEWIADDYSVSSTVRTETSTAGELSSKLPTMSGMISGPPIEQGSDHQRLTTDSSGKFLSATNSTKVELHPKSSRDTTTSGTEDATDAGLDGEAKNRGTFGKALSGVATTAEDDPVDAKVTAAGMQSRQSVNLASMAGNGADIETEVVSVTPAVSSRPDAKGAVPLTVHTIDTDHMTEYIMKAHSDPVVRTHHSSTIAKLKNPKSLAQHVCRRSKCKYLGSYLEVSVPKYNTLCESVIENLYNTASLNFDAVSEIFFQSNPHTVLPMRSFDLKTWRDTHLNQTI